jgi:anti-sigma factor RsiW
MKRHCDDLEPLIEAIADGSHSLSAEDEAHVASCARCGARLERARAIDSLLQMREIAVPPASFTAAVVMQVGHEKWQAERAIDLGFNLAIAAGVAVIVAGAAGLAWSLGFLNPTVRIDLETILQALDTEITGRVLSQVQTIAMSAVLLTMALVLWWWAEAASD